MAIREYARTDLFAATVTIPADAEAGEMRIGEWRQ
jgi:hypothetical protein